ncbi:MULTISPECIES: hypothetical protein [Streptomyces]|uniref:Uncharacterized protein n=1 Tax=Streptomyces kaniharaensis TaxID=212423 RepID=A0A6N7L389_9ACTN|nr:MULTISPECIES: hypothetical protein [Streptomyces]MQS17209.1 hypothetical protein [Streptomyces kaniharaensis]
MFTTATYVTIGGLTVALSFLVWRGVRFFRHDLRSWKALIPFLLGQALGMLSVLCTGGALGYFFGFVAHVMNMGGDKVLSGATGSATPAIHGGAHPGVITPSGAMVLVLLCVGLATAWKSITKSVSLDFGLGAASGSGLGLSAGGAGLAAATLVPLVNGIGIQITGAFN